MFTQWVGPCAAVVLTVAGAARADVILEWNDAYLEAIRQTGPAPGPASRVGAIVHVAIYEAVNSIDRTCQPYLRFEDIPPNASREAAAIGAAHAALTEVYRDVPALVQMFDDLRDRQLGAMHQGDDLAASVRLGALCAKNILSLRSNDGSADEVDYEHRREPGWWQLTPPDYTLAFTPHWLNVKPWALRSSTQFRPRGPNGQLDMGQILRSPEYTEAFNEVKSLGALDSDTRTQEQTFIAIFWANDDDGSYKPPGHLNHIAQFIAVEQGNSLSENARMFALLNLALADAALVAWDVKYGMRMDLWRPITGIREAHRDGNPDTERDPHWEPLSNEVNGFTPPFPSYISGHATLGGAFAAVMEAFYGTDDISFTCTSDYTPGIYRTFNSFSEAGWEDAQSRIYLGVHWRFDAEHGYAAGRSVGCYVVDNYLRPLP